VTIIHAAEYKVSKPDVTRWFWTQTDAGTIVQAEPALLWLYGRYLQPFPPRLAWRRQQQVWSQLTIRLQVWLTVLPDTAIDL
jgi:hypothetical protein